MSTKLKLKLKPRHTVLDLFCGAGGTSEGLVNAGLNVLAGIDIWDTAIESFPSKHMRRSNSFTSRNFCKNIWDKYYRYGSWHISLHDLFYCRCS